MAVSHSPAHSFFIRILREMSFYKNLFLKRRKTGQCISTTCVEHTCEHSCVKARLADSLIVSETTPHISITGHYIWYATCVQKTPYPPPTLFLYLHSNHCCLITRTRTTVCMVYTYTNTIIFLSGLCPKPKNEWNKWKNHFSEMKGDVGISPHEKEREQEDAHPKTESHPTPSLHLFFF